VPAGLGQPAGQLGAAGGLARALQAGHQHHRGQPGRVLQAGRVAAAEQGDHLVADDAQHRLVRGEALQHLLADRALAHPLQELLHHLEVDVRLQQRQPDLAQRLVHVLGRERTPPPEGAEDILQAIAQRIEHVSSSSCCGRTSRGTTLLAHDGLAGCSRRCHAPSEEHHRQGPLAAGRNNGPCYGNRARLVKP
jgi:hypothetical protein